MSNVTQGNHPTIAERIVALHQGLAGRIPQGVLEVFSVEHAGLDANGVPAGVAKPGDRFLDAELLDVHGEPTTFAAARGVNTVVVVLYRGGWCPYCNLTLRAYQEHLVPQLIRRGISLLAISPQKPDGSLSTQEKNELSFTVLSDPGNHVAAVLGVRTTPTEDARAAQRTIGVDLTDANADGTHGLPMPAVVVVDGAGIIRWIDVHPNYTTRTEVSEIINALSTLD
jgi:peroxiredoxin